MPGLGMLNLDSYIQSGIAIIMYLNYVQAISAIAFEPFQDIQVDSALSFGTTSIRS